MSAKTLIIATAALAASAAVLPAAAAGVPRQADRPLGAAVMFNLIDRNADGAIDKDEAGAVTAAVFAAIDANSDGKLTQDEFRTVVNRMHRNGGHGFDRGFGRGGPDFERGGRDGDGRGWHMGRGWPRQGEDLRGGMMGDRGGDECDTARGGPSVGPMMGPGDGPMMRPGDGSMMGPGDGPMMQPGVDQDGARGPRMPDFASVDTNGDGVISQDEFAAAAAIFPGMGPPR